MKKLLLFTSDKVGDTGKVSFNYILQVDGAMEEYPHQCFGPFGVINKTSDQEILYMNAFKGEKGLILAAPICIGNAHWVLNQNKKVVESFPDAFNLLCTKEIADIVAPMFSELGVEVTVIFSKTTLLTH